MKLFQKKYKLIALVALVIGGMICIPLFFVLDGFSNSEALSVQHIKENTLSEYIWTTLRMLLGVGFWSLFLGVPTAYLVAKYDFPLRKLLFKGNMFPLTIPTYIMGFVYASIFSETGTFTEILMNFYSAEEAMAMSINVRTEAWLMFFLGVALFPYVYSSCLIQFTTAGTSQEMAAANLGASPFRRFFKISLPLAVPAIIAGVSLVFMEVLNDFGAMSYFNVKTFTAGIFQAKQMDLDGSAYLAALLFVIVLIVFTGFYGFKQLKKVRRISSSQVNNVLKLKGKRSILVSVVCFFPLFLGFILPVLQLIYLAFLKGRNIWNVKFGIITLNSIQLAIIPAFVILILALILLINKRLNKGVLSNVLANFSTIGYGIPGAVIAVALISVCINVGGSDLRLYNYLVDTLILLMFAYVVRFLAVGYNSAESGYANIGENVFSAARSLGYSPLKTFFKIELPLMKLTLLSSFAILVIDILKELPLTLLLQKSNFDTLATKAYKEAKVAESVMDAAPYSLVLILSGVLVLIFLIKSRNGEFSK